MTPVFPTQILDAEIHFWTARLDPPAATVRRLERVLSPDERARAARYRSEQIARRFRVGRGVLREILGQYLRTDAAGLSFEYGAQGKPALPSKSASGLCFNLSHSDELAVCVVARNRRVGVDVERRRPVTSLERIVDRFFSTREKAAVRALPEGERLDAFFHTWTRKEAYLKGRGDGLSTRLDRFDVSGESVERTVGLGERGTRTDWYLWSLDPAPDYFSAVAVQGSGGRLKRRRWEPSGSLPSE